MSSDHHSLSTLPSRVVLGAALAIALLGAASESARASLYCYGCVLNGAQEVPPNASGSVGGGQFLIDTDANTVTYRIAFTGLSAAETAAHIHGPAGPGVNGGVLVGLPAGNPKVGIWNYAEAQEADILAGRTYANVHSVAFAGGEVRGQIVPLNAQLNGAQEVPPVATPAFGWGVFSIDTTTNTLSYYVAFGGLLAAETAAHIHGTALHGVNAGVLAVLPAGSPKVGAYVYPEALESDILTGKTYVNVHSVAFAGGEIRGQIVPIVAPMDGMQEVPANGTPSAGIALVAYDDPANTLSLDVRFANLSAAETAAHIHGFSAPGANSGVQAVLPAGSPKLATWAYGAANETDVFHGLTYVNVHSAAFPGGEIRGQIQCFLNAPTSSAPTVPQPLALALESPTPNPFSKATSISYHLQTPSRVELRLFDAQGRQVRTLVSADQSAGPHALVWDGTDDAGRKAASGTYWCVLESPSGKISRSMQLIR